MKKLLQLGLILVGVAALTITTANAKCSDGKDALKTMSMEHKDGKCGADMKAKIKDECMKLKMEMDEGKCGADMKEKMKTECKDFNSTDKDVDGMEKKVDDMDKDAHGMKKKMEKKTEKGKCGQGKCSS